MREATGNALLTMMMTSIIAIIMIFFVGSISYTKAYKIKNHIINEIEDNKGWDDNIKTKVDSYLGDAGYYVSKNNSTCPDYGSDCQLVYNHENYDYCVYKCGINSTDVNISYKVITHMKFDFPVIGSMIKFDVKGETGTFGDFN